ncbi:2-amino-4-hydroxy-6-hydroxymethyldihydropteridine diphosphokinase [Deinococcus metallilatus]|uniref:2-amino-4-hydroxy-6-hydroxymethyldihydropteridine diphosphokinase n=1 Tax=Deinococcus metallilatus TaxID=1211322 RepID=A0AAJ5F533_9DEIO|nr:2-amino-4-hydroxy-6-hydroxymethyldihydropteridine diphosphokinase [Deinococcus metallilatus]MBB5295609.1 2-amino-4-hydroxy-6-hydroxymethyldihydropteridine diphosphokinase [Deinococcus metallilatus]QBY07883.1 2-amino-4-hydroxy-6-hydroxymethyldihydropteridine diphosphokinase [Deinococcus metallilatus]RXJ12776.1 2-amino-4-hydroxy-6-hydroxymethyldihydropteridine diphosphokinase [Deinococcus metallilatus]TLK27302.1 2-amino-4-hydroxy-6-hydroxymethyldihydropteridine diphosphokinase [Deinococcus met
MSGAAFIALGANLGEPLATLRRAREALGTLGTLTGVSSLYRTAPVGGPPGQPDYLNAAVRLQTALAPAELLAALHATEARAGRVRRERWEARTLDLDLILYGGRVQDTPGLTLPHPRAWERAFVLAPLADLDPELAHPVSGETVGAALNRVGLGGVTRVATDW